MFFNVIKASFMQRRKTLSNGLVNGGIVKNKAKAIEILTADTVSEDYLKNHGYSPVFIQATHKSIAEANGEEMPTYYEHKIYKKGIVRGVRRFFMYMDPAYDDQSFKNNHKIHTSPNIGDL